jgi:tetratricopeptide (TPR) repeat protein
VKIFVSSTYTDLIDHRKAAERAINLLDQQFKGMEYFGARPEEPKAACLKEIEQADIFVGIYAHRYGFIPEGDTKSITEQEFDHAKKLGKPIFCYRVNADFPWSPKFIERGEAEKKLAAFIARIEKDFVRSEFTTPDDLLAKIAANLARYLTETRQISPSSLISLPPIPYFVHSYPLQANFTGRKAEHAELNDWLGRDARAVFVLEAIGGMGKSALAWVWTQEIFSLGIPVAGVFWWSFYEERDLGRFLDKAIAYASGGKVDAKQISSDRERVDVLANLLRQSRFLFVLDGFERVLRAYARMDAAYRGDEVDDREHNYRACADPNIGIFLRCLASGGALTKTLITSRLFPRELDELENARHLELKGMDESDAVEFFHKQGIKGNRKEIIDACAAYGFHPLTLRLLAGALKQDPRYHADIRNAPLVEMRDADKDKRMARMLDFAYDSLPRDEQKLLSQLSAFRSPMKWETIRDIFMAPENGTRTNADERGENKNPRSSAVLRVPFKNQGELARAISNLAERGLYMRDASTDTFDLHPVIRRYCYDRLTDKQQTHAVFIVYFAKIEKPKKIQTLADLQPTIELYHHTVRAGRYDEARTLFRDRLSQATYYQLGAYQLRIELLRALFPDGEDKPPRLKDEAWQAWTLNSLANSYSLAGQPRRAVPLFLQAVKIGEKAGDKKNLAIGLGNVAYMAQIQLGELKAAEQNLRRSIEICREIKDEFWEAVGHRELGRVLAYRGQFAETERELDVAFEMFGKDKNVQSQSVVSAYRALRALLMGDASAALASAHQAREFAEEDARTQYPVEADFIRAEWMIGAALVAGMTPTPTLPRRQNQPTGEGASSPPAKRGELEGGAEAEHHLQESLARDRAIGMVDHEAAILLQFAKLRYAQARQQPFDSAQSADDRQQKLDESFDFAREALQIAERCEYRLQQAEIQNFLAEWWMAKDQGGRMKDEKISAREALAKAREHAERAKERAWCDGAPYHYQVAYERAESLLKMIAKESR